MTVRAVMLVDAGFQDEEHVYAYYRMKEELWTVDIATPDGKDRFGKFGVPARANAVIANLKVDDYDAVVIPGGFESPDRLRLTFAPEFVRRMFERKKLCAAICHGPSVLISAQIVRGRKVTAFLAIKDDLVNAGAEYLDLPVVVDGNLITAPHYRNNGDFGRAVVSYFRVQP
jgi:protease I